MKSISLKLPDELHAKLGRIAEERGTVKSDIIRAALERYVAGVKEASGVSCLDLAGDLVGSVEGPRDLATNPKHMRGYGK